MDNRDEQKLYVESVVRYEIAANAPLEVNQEESMATMNCKKCGQIHPVCPQDDFEQPSMQGCIAPDKVEMTSDAMCQNCGTRLRIPLQRDWSSPLYVMHMEKEHKMLRDILCHMKKDLLELAAECVDAGVRPEVLKRADRMKKQFDELKRRFGIE